jgi:hypothetical protein
MFFVFAAMMEFAVVLVVKQKMDGIKIRPKKEEDDIGRGPSQKEKHLQMKNRNEDQFPEEDVQNQARTGCFDSFALNRKIDFAAFFIFIFGFSVFNIIYWTQIRQDFVI